MRLPAGPDLTVSLKPAADALAGGVERQNKRILIVSTFQMEVLMKPLVVGVICMNASKALKSLFILLDGVYTLPFNC